jgi:hypothetical protein
MLLVVVLVYPAVAWKTVHEERMLCEVERRRTAVWLPFRSKGEGKDKPIPLAIQNKNLGAEKGSKRPLFDERTSFLAFFGPP